MIIVDAIESAASEHAVFFLLTAYVESLRHFEVSSGVPERFLRLPIIDRDDLAARIRAVENDSGLPAKTRMPASEALAVMSSALRRLAQLETSQRRELRAA